MKFDPTKNRIPAELLTKKERAAMRECCHGYQIYGEGDWLTFDRKSVQPNDILRAKPAPDVSSDIGTQDIVTLQYELLIKHYDLKLAALDAKRAKKAGLKP